MTPLFAAIAHGCAAEREAETLSEVYWPRIARGNENFRGEKLGLFGQELAALAAFFETPFTKPSPRLSPGDQALALNFAGFRLRALGRLEDAAEPMRAALELTARSEAWENASGNAGNLSELLLTIGRHRGRGRCGRCGRTGGFLRGPLWRCLPAHGHAHHPCRCARAGRQPRPRRGAVPRGRSAAARETARICPRLIRCKATAIAISSSPAAAPPKPPPGMHMSS